ncbi:MAG: hypothetical protein QOF48_3524 [Verrucomicrobiota bacterium]
MDTKRGQGKNTLKGGRQTDTKLLMRFLYAQEIAGFSPALRAPCPVTASSPPPLLHFGNGGEGARRAGEEEHPSNTGYGAQSAHNGPGDFSSISEVEEKVEKSTGQ